MRLILNQKFFRHLSERAGLENKYFDAFALCLDWAVRNYEKLDLSMKNLPIARYSITYYDQA